VLKKLFTDKFSFRFGAALGNEVTFATLLPFLFWCADDQLARHEIMVWAIVCYAGQYIKDILQLPRPKSPPVAHLEDHYVNEYGNLMIALLLITLGLPSTHAMSAITLSIYLFYFLHTRYGCPLWVGVTLSILWITIVCCSRPYLGVHSFLDVYTGLIIGGLLMYLAFPLCQYLDWFLVNNESGFKKMTSILGVCIALVLIYPKSREWTSGYGDTCRILGACTGALMGVCLLNPATLHTDTSHRPFFFPNTISSLAVVCFRAIVGYAVLIITKTVVKILSFAIVPHILQMTGIAPARLSDKPNSNRYIVEIPCVLAAYIALSFSVSYISPMYIFENDQIKGFINLGWEKVVARSSPTFGARIF
jgi:membrane-associated phospholipid phosphatase